MPTGNAQPWSRRNEGPLSVATRTPFTLPQHNLDKSGSVEIARILQRHRAPKAESRRRVQGGGAGDTQETYLTRAALGRLRFRDQLLHSPQVIGMLLLPTGEGGAVQTRGRGV